jgi:hypothetical protein
LSKSCRGASIRIAKRAREPWAWSRLDRAAPVGAPWHVFTEFHLLRSGRGGYAGNDRVLHNPNNNIPNNQQNNTPTIFGKRSLWHCWEINTRARSLKISDACVGSIPRRLSGQHHSVASVISAKLIQRKIDLIQGQRLDGCIDPVLRGELKHIRDSCRRSHDAGCKRKFSKNHR